MIIRLTHAMEKRKSSVDSTSRHIHPAHELILVKRGRIRTVVGERVFELVPGILLIIPKSLHHEVHILEPDTVFINIMYRGKLFAELELNPVQLLPEECQFAERVVQNMLPPFDYFRAELAVAYLIILLCTVASRIQAENPVQRKNSSNVRQHISRLVMEVMEYMWEHYREPITLSETARYVGISPSYLRHLLLKETGCGFSAHLLQIRIEQVKKMIAESPENIKSIANECGFNSMAFFYKTFKRITGKTPLEYGKSL